MPWVAACFDLLAAPLLGYCLAIRKLALQTGILQERRSDLVGKQTSSNTRLTISNTDTANMVPNAEERQGNVTFDFEGMFCVTSAYIIRIFSFTSSRAFSVFASTPGEESIRLNDE